MTNMIVIWTTYDDEYFMDEYSENDNYNAADRKEERKEMMEEEGKGEQEGKEKEHKETQRRNK